MFYIKLIDNVIDNYSMVVAWLIGSALVSTNVVTLRRARLILGWVTVYG